MNKRLKRLVHVLRGYGLTDHRLIWCGKDGIGKVRLLIPNSHFPLERRMSFRPVGTVHAFRGADLFLLDILARLFW